MNIMPTVEALCNLVEKQNAIIRAQASALHQLDMLCMEDEVAAAEELYNMLLGCGGSTAEDGRG